MSNLHQVLNDYLMIRRELGYKLIREGMWLPKFITYVENEGSTFITTKLALSWATQSVNASTISHAKRLGMIRLFAQYVRALDPRTEIPSKYHLQYRKQRPIPYIYSDADVQSILRITQNLGGRLRSSTYATLFGLLAVTGMRLGEVIDLNCCDVNLDEKFLVVRHSKFNKSRQVPIHPTTAEALRAYNKKRKQIFVLPHTGSFLVSERGKKLLSQNVHRTFWYLRRMAGLDRISARKPRIHDLRHSFAVKTLTNWYQAGVDVEPRLPILSTYLGHVSPSSTYWYLTATPELLALAAKRLERYSGRLP